MSTSDRVGPLHSIEIPELGSYSDAELSQANQWPAIDRYRALLNRKASTIPDRLRLKRHHAWLRCALATYFDRSPARDVCLFWSRIAQELIQEAWQLAGGDGSETCVLALGKLGAEELNLSSDVDLILVRADGSEPPLKAQREFQSLLSDYTEFGFCLRVDFTLRPGGRSAAIAPSLSEFENHYGYHGEMWERLAFVRMRILCGPEKLHEQIQQFARKFSYRKHLDYTLLDDLKSLKTKIRQEKFETRPGHFHLKLGEGGIRELELFVHALQVMHGGRTPPLQTHSTTEALQVIQSLQLLPSDECESLMSSYWLLRTLENKIQAYEDQQTYLVDFKQRNPALPDDFAIALKQICSTVTGITSSLFW